MGYKKAEEVLPGDLIDRIQQYVDDEMIYIPRRSDKRRAWGAGTQIRKELSRRNRQIYKDYLGGEGILELAGKYYLSEKSIQRIIREERENLII